MFPFTASEEDDEGEDELESEEMHQIEVTPDDFIVSSHESSQEKAFLLATKLAKLRHLRASRPQKSVVKESDSDTFFG